MVLDFSSGSLIKADAVCTTALAAIMLSSDTDQGCEHGPQALASRPCCRRFLFMFITLLASDGKPFAFKFDTYYRKNPLYAGLFTTVGLEQASPPQKGGTFAHHLLAHGRRHFHLPECHRDRNQHGHGTGSPLCTLASAISRLAAAGRCHGKTFVSMATQQVLKWGWAAATFWAHLRRPCRRSPGPRSH